MRLSGGDKHCPRLSPVIRAHEMMTQITLPWPPSVNAYYRSPNKGPLAGRTLISEAGRAYRTAVHEIVSEGRMAASYAGPVAVEIEAHMPDKRRRDLDNLLKGLFDALTHAGVWLDDSQVDDFRVRRARHPDGSLRIGGMVKVVVHPMEASNG